MLSPSQHIGMFMYGETPLSACYVFVHQHHSPQQHSVSSCVSSTGFTAGQCQRLYTRLLASQSRLCDAHYVSSMQPVTAAAAPVHRRCHATGVFTSPPTKVFTCRSAPPCGTAAASPGTPGRRETLQQGIGVQGVPAQVLAPQSFCGSRPHHRPACWTAKHRHMLAKLLDIVLPPPQQLQ